MHLIPAQFRMLARIAAVLFLIAVGWVANGWRLNAKADREAAERKQAENAAILTRVKNNERKAEQDKANSARIAKEHKRELDKVRADIAADRVRVGPGFCSGFAEGTEADSPGGSDGANPGSRLLPPEIERDIKSLKDEMERATAAGRAAQEFIRSNGMAPE